MPLDRIDPAAVDADSAELFGEWELLRDFFSLETALPAGDLTLLDVIAATSPADAHAGTGGPHRLGRGGRGF